MSTCIFHQEKVKREIHSVILTLRKYCKEMLQWLVLNLRILDLFLNLFILIINKFTKNLIKHHHIFPDDL